MVEPEKKDPHKPEADPHKPEAKPKEQKPDINNIEDWPDIFGAAEQPQPMDRIVRLEQALMAVAGKYRK